MKSSETYFKEEANRSFVPRCLSLHSSSYSHTAYLSLNTLTEFWWDVLAPPPQNIDLSHSDFCPFMPTSVARNLGQITR
jgi:hypothetical protein